MNDDEYEYHLNTEYTKLIPLEPLEEGEVDEAVRKLWNAIQESNAFYRWLEEL